MSEINGFYTLKGYQLIEEARFTSAMEDYLEMICRIVLRHDTVRIRDLAQNLNVKPSSASKMVQNLNELGYIKSERYGSIALTEKGNAAGSYLIYRHNVIHTFLCLLNNSQNELEETEKIEHFLTKRTVTNLDALIKRISS